ncbi:MAG TPA: serine hydrolase domain-containing protein [Pyrinomonadaceae bacterium]|nr:serine hydrolase domain-containing protein [Pyrinomonadaceae bacterium]HMP64431.1 serine hydrolase domain-containing protein [Pyrinomonadaceae bacterium]
MKNRSAKALLSATLILGAAFAAGTIPATGQAPGLTKEKIEAIEKLVSAERDEQKIPGLSVAIGVGGKIVFEQGFGLADLENDVRATAATRYRTASIAKPMTAVAVMQLAAAGKLDLDADIRKYCPAFPEKKWPVTARQLLAHLGGVRHYNRPGEASGTEFYPSVAASLALFKDEPLLHEPGTRYHYTTYGYTVLGCAIEGASGESYEAIMARSVFGPAGMTRTVIDSHQAVIANRSRGYSMLNDAAYRQLSDDLKKVLRPNEVYNAQLHDTSMKIPGGGLLSTSGDLVRFAFAAGDGKLLDSKWRELMWTRQRTTGGEDLPYGLGWGINVIDGGIRLIGHSGSQAGTSTFLAYARDRGVAVAVMCNRDGASANRITLRLLEIMTREE